jgi:hypothetical protein
MYVTLNSSSLILLYPFIFLNSSNNSLFIFLPKCKIDSSVLFSMSTKLDLMNEDTTGFVGNEQEPEVWT